MNDRTRTGLEILQAAILLGILADVMMRSDRAGLNMLLVVGATASAMVMLFWRRQRAALDKRTGALIGALIFFSAMFAWRESPQLLAADFLSMVVIFAVLALPVMRINVSIAGVSHYILGFISSTVHVFFAPLLLAIDDIKWPEVPQKGLSRHIISVIRGLLIAVPLIVIFGGLFMAADAAFEGLVKRAFNIDFDIVISHVIVTGVLSWFAAGYLRGILIEPLSGMPNVSIVPKAEPEIVPSATSVTDLPSDEPQEKAKPEPDAPKHRNWQDFDNSSLPSFLRLDTVEAGVILGLVDLLFLAFVIVQLPYLFGGMDLVQNTPDFKLAEFARRGFGELVVVAALVLPILLVSHWLLRKDSPVALKLFRVLASVQIVLLFVIMASAVQRILLLTGPLGYGMTTLRFYPLVFMIWLAVVFGWFAVTVLRGSRRYFAWGALWSAFVLLGALHFFNPDAFIARWNIDLMKQGREYDAAYNVKELSADAVPALIDALQYMNSADYEKTREILSVKTRPCHSGKDFRSWNLSRKTAFELVNTRLGIADISDNCE